MNSETWLRRPDATTDGYLKYVLLACLQSFKGIRLLLQAGAAVLLAAVKAIASSLSDGRAEETATLFQRLGAEFTYAALLGLPFVVVAVAQTLASPFRMITQLRRTIATFQSHPDYERLRQRLDSTRVLLDRSPSPLDRDRLSNWALHADELGNAIWKLADELPHSDPVKQILEFPTCRPRERFDWSELADIQPEDHGIDGRLMERVNRAWDELAHYEAGLREAIHYLHGSTGMRRS